MSKTEILQLKLLSAKVIEALEETNGRMFWDVLVDQVDIMKMLRDFLAEDPNEQFAMESTIERIMNRHEQTMVDASREQVRRETRTALENLN